MPHFRNIFRTENSGGRQRSYSYSARDRSHDGTERGAGGSGATGTGGHGHSSMIPKFLRSTGALGLPKAELDRRCVPSGLYESCQWEDKAIRRLIGDGKLAARLKGNDSRTNPGDRECPICFLHYSQVNLTTCCKAALCTECYLQVRPQRQKDCPCPFCNRPKVTITVAEDMRGSDVTKRDREEQKVIEAQIRAAQAQ
eukprot:CAMPEP_0183304100 /NCGR_PEP_ID=MMETSP0160_2-20130417/9307_1 /TAXON_ID=2839 ORGANISM="Odontella Sinensis, Strain Grunow 1884" /NCGR_SAMPLE_ID=MMETSP0160_2 /ASSEMBLY_ACC=CAM_ASM_000250 /LENGTH=197 /DNA_ID=CAMNT_0025467093 /DNA_START=225 /DNA_END=815 /DNA_ORIENTATION=+